MSTSPTRIGYFQVAPHIGDDLFTEIVASARYLCSKNETLVVRANPSPVRRFVIVFRNTTFDDFWRAEDLFENIVGRITGVRVHRNALAKPPILLAHDGSTDLATIMNLLEHPPEDTHI